MMLEQQRGLISTGGLRLVTGSWRPAGPPRAIVALAHGYAEHMGRYLEVIAALVDAGFAVVAVDHRGHGASDGRRASIRRFDDYVDDFHLVVERARTADPGLPIFLLGHSMGGLIVVRYALAHGEGLAGAIVSGAALIIDEGVSPVTRWTGLVVARLAPELPLIAAEPGALSADPAVERAFAGDPRCYHGRTRAGLAAQLLRAGEDARRRLDRLTLPLLILHGADDTLTSPNGSRLLYDRAASTDKTLALWPNERHEPHNGPNRRAVIDRMVDWLDARAPPSFQRP